MGRGRKQGGERPWRQHEGQYEPSGGGDWSLWRGAWKASPKHPGRNPRQASAFPAYDREWQAAAAIVEVKPPGMPTAPQRGGMVYDVQQAINGARRLEQRLQKIRTESLQRGRAWDQWVQDMRTSYAKESERHAAEQRRLDTEICELEEQVQEAYGRVQHAALYQAQASTPSAQHSPLAWESAMEVEETMTDAQMKVELDRMAAQARAMRGAASPTRHIDAAPRSPAPAASAKASASPTVTPVEYPTPPGFGGRPTGTVADPRGVPPPAHPEPHSTGHGPSLAEKLSDKRRAHRERIAPIPGADAKEAPSRVDPSPPREVEMTAAPANIIADDDDDELRTAPSPGLGRLDA